MKKKMVVLCLLVILVFIMTPFVSAVKSVGNQSTIVTETNGSQTLSIEETPEHSLRNGYLLLLVFAYKPGQGMSPVAGANITARSIFHRYNGTTDSSGVCVIKVRAPLLRDRFFFIKVSVINTDGQTHSRIAFMSMRAWHIATRIFLFANA